MSMVARQAQENIDKIVGGEPKNKGETLDNMTLGRILTWYSNNKDSKDAIKYAKDYLTKNKITFSTTAVNAASRQFGFVCRILTNGALLDEKNQKWFNDRVADIQTPTVETVDAVNATNVRSNKPNIQDRIAEQANAITAELEGALDDFIISGCKSNYDPLGLMVSLNTKYVHVNRIIEVFKKYRAEFDGVIDSTDNYVQESYSNFNKTQLKKVVAFCDQVLKDAGSIVAQAKSNRKPRKSKQKTPDQLVNKLNYLKEFDLEGLKLSSIDPSKIVGSSQIFVYNIKTKKLGVYYAEDGTGLSVKGSSIIGFATPKSIGKTLRKPVVTIKEVLTGGKVVLKNIMSKLTTKESLLTGRLNGDTIILRVN